MEEKNNIVKQKESDQSSPPRPSTDNNKSNQQDKLPRKSKKDNLNDKKKTKNKPKEESNLPNPNNSSIQLTIPPLQPHQPIAEPLSKALKEISQKIIEQKLPHPLDKLLKRPSYIHLGGLNRLYGAFGHGTAYFKRPVLEGSFYMEFVFKQDKKIEKKTAFPPAVRIGMCIYKFNHSFPLGWDESIAYKSTDGSIIYKGQTIHKGQSFKVGDLITIFIKMSPPYKHADATKISSNSSVSFYKNGVLIFCFEELKQTFYCFGVSTFNYSQVQLISKASKNEIYSKGRHYLECLKDKIPYKDLQESGIFKI